MNRWTYCVMLLGIAGLAATFWKQHQGTSQLLAWLEPRQAEAQETTYAGPPPAWQPQYDARTVAPNHRAGMISPAGNLPAPSGMPPVGNATAGSAGSLPPWQQPSATTSPANSYQGAAYPVTMPVGQPQYPAGGPPSSQYAPPVQTWNTPQAEAAMPYGTGPNPRSVTPPAGAPVRTETRYSAPWTGQALPAETGSPAHQPVPPALVSAPTADLNATIIARIDGEVILFGEVLPAVEAQLEQVRAKIPAGKEEEIRELLIRKFMQPIIQRKMVYIDAKREIPAENFPKVTEQLDAAFEGWISHAIERYKLKSRVELGEKLKEQGSSLERQRQTHNETALSRQWIKKNTEINKTVTRAELWEYYQAHLEDYEIQAQVRWEELMISLDEVPNKQEAYFACARLGNRVLDGQPVSQVAKDGSHGFTAADGGEHKWTNRGSLVSSKLDEALFTLPVGQLSPIIETEEGFHIVRVIERKEAGYVPFPDTQAAVREKILDKRREGKEQEYFKRLAESVRIWTIFDDKQEEQTAENTDRLGTRR